MKTSLSLFFLLFFVAFLEAQQDPIGLCGKVKKATSRERKIFFLKELEKLGPQAKPATQDLFQIVAFEKDVEVGKVASQTLRGLDRELEEWASLTAKYRIVQLAKTSQKRVAALQEIGKMKDQGSSIKWYLANLVAFEQTQEVVNQAKILLDRIDPDLKEGALLWREVRKYDLQTFRPQKETVAEKIVVIKKIETLGVRGKGCFRWLVTKMLNSKTTFEEKMALSRALMNNNPVCAILINQISQAANDKDMCQGIQALSLAQDNQGAVPFVWQGLIKIFQRKEFDSIKTRMSLVPFYAQKSYEDPNLTDWRFDKNKTPKENMEEQARIMKRNQEELARANKNNLQVPDFNRQVDEANVAIQKINQKTLQDLGTRTISSNTIISLQIQCLGEILEQTDRRHIDYLLSLTNDPLFGADAKQSLDRLGERFPALKASNFLAFKD